MRLFSLKNCVDVTSWDCCPWTTVPSRHETVVPERLCGRHVLRLLSLKDCVDVTSWDCCPWTTVVDVTSWDCCPWTTVWTSCHETVVPERLWRWRRSWSLLRRVWRKNSKVIIIPVNWSFDCLPAWHSIMTRSLVSLLNVKLEDSQNLSLLV